MMTDSAKAGNGDSPPDGCPVVPETDDPSFPVMTFRTRFLGMASCVLLIFLNTFFTFRTQALTVSSILMQIPLKCGGLQTLLKCRFEALKVRSCSFLQLNRLITCDVSFFLVLNKAMLTTQLELSDELFNRRFTKKFSSNNEVRIHAKFYFGYITKILIYRALHEKEQKS